VFSRCFAVRRMDAGYGPQPARTLSRRQLQAEQPPCPQLPEAAAEAFSVFAPSPESAPLDSVGVLLALPDPFLKSVAYQPLPRN
jgi:hypothetical protein